VRRADLPRSEFRSVATRADAGRVLGVVLCGGKSARMGTDKALIPLGSSTMLERAATTLAELTPRVVLACGASERYAELGLPLVVDRYLGAGPLAGLEAALASAVVAGEDWLVALACDLPRVRPSVLANLLSRAREDDLDACFFETELGLEPLCAVYRATCLPSVRAALDAGERKMIAFLQHATASGELPRIATVRADAFVGDLVNVNSPADVVALARHEDAP
jgi:molybdopterin-guanine dinucleotide biosynthesis protein A